MPLLDDNLKFSDGLDIRIRQFYCEFCQYCNDHNVQFRTLEGRRSYARQISLYTQGRSRDDITGAKLGQKVTSDLLALYDAGKNLSGARVTWTIDSDHIRGLAVDVQPINVTHSDLEIIAGKWNIKHPYMYDMPHYQLTYARAAEPDIHPNPDAMKKALERRYENEQNPELKETIFRRLLRLTQRIKVL